jgi:hypothetical protein
MRLSLPVLVLGLVVPLGLSAQVSAQAQASVLSAASATASASGEALPSISEMLPPGVRPGVGLLAASTGKGAVLNLAPRMPGNEAEAGDASAPGAAPALRIEFLALLPPRAGAASSPGPVQAAILSKLALAAASTRGLAGLEYWSASRGRMRTLYSKAYRVVSGERRIPLPDPADLGDLGGAQPWRLFVWLEDLTFGGNPYSFDVSVGKRELRLEITNLETVRYLLLPVAKPGAMRERIEAFPCAEGLLVHFSSVLEAPGFGAERVFESAGNKGLAVLGWFAGRAAALGLSAPVSIPLKMEEALRPAGLP